MTEPTNSNQVDQILTARAGYFPDFYRPFLDLFISQLKVRVEALQSGSSIQFDSRSICGKAGSDLLDELMGVATRTLVFEFQTLRMADENISYSSFERYVADPQGQRETLNKYPELASLLTNQVNARLHLLANALKQLVADRGVITRSGLGEVEFIHELQCSTGDAHNSGKKVLIVVFSGGRIVYKPRSLKPEVLAEKVVDLMNEHLCKDIRLSPPIAIDRGSYGWQQYVSHESCVTETDVEHFFYRIGAYAALFRALGSTDMHFENLIAAAAHPMFIDLETLALNHSSKSQTNTLSGSIAEEFSDSILSSMLFPVRVAGSLFDINLAGLGSPFGEESSKWKNFSLVDVGTDLMRFEQKTVVIEHGENLVRIGSDVVDSSGYGDEIRSGYRAGAESLRRSTQRLVSIVKESSGEGLRMRQVLRPTAVYARFLEASTHPRYLTNNSDRLQLFEKLGKPANVPPDFQSQVLAQEVAQMERGDVPYFYSDYDSRSLGSSVGAEIPKFYPTSLGDQILNGVSTDRLAVPSNVRDEYLIQASLSTVVREPWSSGSRKSSFLMSGAPVDDPLDFASYIGDFFSQTAVWDSKKDSCSWITPLLASTDDVMLGPLNSTLYEGGGVLLFLAELGKVTGQPEYTDLAIGGARAISSWPGAETSEGIRDLSAFSGLGSSLYITTALKELTGDAEIARKLDELKSLVPTLTLGTDQPDYVGGLAGLAVVLTNMQKRGESQFREVIGLLHTVLLSALVNGPNRPNDLAHGASGVALALSYTSVELADTEAQSEVERYFARLTSDPSVSEWQLVRGSSWCKGKLGVTAAAVRSMTILGHNENESSSRVDRLISDSLASRNPLDLDISLCHGRAGQVQSILQIANDLRRTDLREMSKAMLLDILQDAAGGYIGGLANNSGMLTYMLGLTGVAHTALLLHDSNLPLSLSLDFEPTEVRNS